MSAFVISSHSWKSVVREFIWVTGIVGEFCQSKTEGHVFMAFIGIITNAFLLRRSFFIPYLYDQLIIFVSLFEKRNIFTALYKKLIKFASLYRQQKLLLSISSVEALLQTFGTLHWAAALYGVPWSRSSSFNCSKLFIAILYIRWFLLPYWSWCFREYISFSQMFG